jgi:hypothetical protein
MFKRIMTRVKERKRPIDEEQRERKQEKKEKEFPKQVKIVATPVYQQDYPPTVCFALAINQKLDANWQNWTSEQIIKYSEIPFEYVVDYAFSKGNNHIVLANNIESVDEGWQCEMYIDDQLIGKGIVSYTAPLQINMVVGNNMMVPRKSFRNGWFRTKTIRGMQPNFLRLKK